MAAKMRGDAADDRDDEHRLGREAEEDVAARDHVDAGRDHRRGVDERRDGRRAGHGVGEPDVERDLGALADGAEEEAEADERSGPARTGRDRRRRSRRRRSKSSVPKSEKRPNIPSRKPKSPIRLTTNAFLPAAAANSWSK